MNSHLSSFKHRLSTTKSILYSIFALLANDRMPDIVKEILNLK